MQLSGAASSLLPPSVARGIRTTLKLFYFSFRYSALQGGGSLDPEKIAHILVKLREKDLQARASS